jgi:hypothetical protein
MEISKDFVLLLCESKNFLNLEKEKSVNEYGYDTLSRDLHEQYFPSLLDTEELFSEHHKVSIRGFVKIWNP